MPVTDAEKEILFHQPATLKQTPDSADPKKVPAPPSRRIVRPSADAGLDVIRQSAASDLPPGHSPPAGSAQSPQVSDARAQTEFAAAAARARAAVSQPSPAAQPQVAQPQVAPLRAKSAGTPTPPGDARSPLAPSAPVAPLALPHQQVSEAPPLEPVPMQNSAPAPAVLPREQVSAEPSLEPVPMRASAPAPARAQVQAEPEPAGAAALAGIRPEPEPQPEQRHKRAAGSKFLLHTHGLKKVYDGRAVVNGVEITVRPSEIVGLLGPNGAGKTTTFYMIVGLIQPNGGSVTFDGKDATRQPMYRRARLGMGYLPQEESIFRKLSVQDNLLAVMETQNIPRSERRDRCNELMKRFGIEKLARNEAITLSGGEKRRLTIARSLVTEPKLLMLDEPFSGVDPIAVGEIQEIVRSLREQGLAILITDHNVRETLDIVDRAYLLFEGRVEREGTRDFLINDPLSRQLYLGERFSM